MAKFSFNLDTQGVIELLKSSDMGTIVSQYADTVQDYAGDDFESKMLMGRDRVTYIVYPTSIEAAKKNQKNDILTNALGAARR